MADRTAAPRKHPRQQRSRETVDRILDAAARIFDERGYRATTTNHVAELAGVSIGSLYQYFPNKDALLVALARRHVHAAAEHFAQLLAELRRDPPTIDVVVRTLVSASVDANDSTRLHAVLFADSPRTPELTAEFDRFTEHLVDEIVWHLERTGRGGSEPRRRAHLVVSAVDAAVHEVVLTSAPGAERAAATAELADLVLHGIDRRPSADRRGGARSGN